LKVALEDIETEYYALWDPPGWRPAPFGLIRAEGPVVSRWLPGKEAWVEAPQEWDYLMGNEPGARQISADQAEELKASGVLAELTDEAIVIISTFKPHGG
jgi:hypothetical protein